MTLMQIAWLWPRNRQGMFTCLSVLDEHIFIPIYPSKCNYCLWTKHLLWLWLEFQFKFPWIWLTTQSLFQFLLFFSKICQWQLESVFRKWAGSSFGLVGLPLLEEPTKSWPTERNHKGCLHACQHSLLKDSSSHRHKRGLPFWGTYILTYCLCEGAANLKTGSLTGRGTVFTHGLKASAIDGGLYLLQVLLFNKYNPAISQPPIFILIKLFPILSPNQISSYWSFNYLSSFFIHFYRRLSQDSSGWGTEQRSCWSRGKQCFLHLKRP